MHARVLFDVVRQPFPMLVVWSCLGGFAFGVIVLLSGRLRTGPRARLAKLFGYFIAISAVVSLGYYSILWYWEMRGYRRQLAQGHYEVAEGVVESFHPQSPDGKSKESFVLAGHMFSYSDYVEARVDVCFNKTSLNRGPIRAGIALRIKYSDNCILRIEELPERSSSSAVADE